MCVCVLFLWFYVDALGIRLPRRALIREARPGPRPVGPPPAPAGTSSPPLTCKHIFLYIKNKVLFKTILLCFALPRTISCLLSPSSLWFYHWFIAFLIHLFTCMHFPFLFFYKKINKNNQKIRGKKEVRGRNGQHKQKRAINKEREK